MDPSSPVVITRGEGERPHYVDVQKFQDFWTPSAPPIARDGEVDGIPVDYHLRRMVYMIFYLHHVFLCATRISDCLSAG